jgi:hypothetical protein
MEKAVITNQWEPSGVWEQSQFKLLFTVVFCWFFFAAIMRLITFRRERGSDSCWREAQKLSYGLTPYVFMRI